MSNDRVDGSNMLPGFCAHPPRCGCCGPESRKKTQHLIVQATAAGQVRFALKRQWLMLGCQVPTLPCSSDFGQSRLPLVAIP